MRSFLTPVILLLMAHIILADKETFKNKKIKVGKRTCTCTITFIFTGTKVDTKKSKATCDKKCKGSAKKQELVGEANIFNFDLTVSKGGKGTLSKASVTPIGPVEPTGTGSGSGIGPTDFPTGSGSGFPTGFPTGSGSGSGMPTIFPTMPTGGSGSGSGPVGPTDFPTGSGSGFPTGWPTGWPTMPTGGSGSGYTWPPGGSGYTWPSLGGDCSDGFVKVCSQTNGYCPPESMTVCPRMMMPMGRMMPMDDSCVCMPLAVMELVIEQDMMTGRSLDRANNKDIFKNYEVNKKCKCTFTFVVAGDKVKSSKGTCPKSCNIKKPQAVGPLDGNLGSYNFKLKVVKGKATLTGVKFTAWPTETEPPYTMPPYTPMPPTSTGCVCVYGAGGGYPSSPYPTWSPGPTGGSGSSPHPPTGETTPSTGGNGTTAVMTDCNCGLAQRTTRIVGGVETEVNEYPWQVGMVTKGQTYIWCGGSIISDQWVMTAAHCVTGESAGGLEVLLGEHDKTSTTESDMVRMGLSKIVSHADYDSSTTDYDFALLKLKEPINFAEHPHIRPICLPVDDSKDYADYIATVSGWGTLWSSGPGPDVLMEVDVKVLSQQACKNDYNYPSSAITDQMVCASAEDGNGGKDSCQGDSGGPLVTKETASDGQTAGQNYELIGVVSWGWGCANADEPGVYSRMTKQLDWTYQKTAGSFKTCSRV